MPETIDDQLQQVVKISRRTVFAVVAAAIILAGGGLATAVVLLVQANERISSTCAFMRDVGTAPITPAAGVPRPSKLGVTLVADSRNAYYGLGCAPAPLPPDPALDRWAAYYHVRLARG